MRNVLLLIIAGAMLSACGNSNQGPATVGETDSVAYYQEAHRLQFHFSPEANWMNDPNGLVYLDGTYHMFYQYYPDSTVWGPMHWGHTTSKDLVHWEHQPVALYPDSLGYIFSGSAVYDKNNTSGLGTKEEPPLVAIFTYHDPKGAEAGTDTFQTQGIAYSLDKGATWIKYDGNPVLHNPGITDFRDPKVFWMEAQQKWVMSLAVKDHISFYTSPNLKDWEWMSDFGQEIGAHGGVWECPDLIQLNGHWVLLVSINPGGPNGGSATQYFVGNFDGTAFEPYDDNIRWIDWGRDNYAGVTWSNIPGKDGRTLFIGWMSNWNYGQVVPTSPWRSAMTVARSLSLDSTAAGYKLKSYPVKEFNRLRGEDISIVESDARVVVLNPANYKTYDLNINIDAIEPFEIQLFNAVGDTLSIGYNADSSFFYINRDRVGNNEFSELFGGLQKAQYEKDKELLNLRLIVDVGSVELFVNEGGLVMTSLFFPNEPLDRVQFVNLDEESAEVGGTIYELRGIW